MEPQPAKTSVVAAGGKLLLMIALEGAPLKVTDDSILRAMVASEAVDVRQSISAAQVAVREQLPAPLVMVTVLPDKVQTPDAVVELAGP